MEYRHPSPTQICLALLLLLTLGAACFRAAPARAQADNLPAPVDVASLGDSLKLTPHIAYLRDPTGAMTAAEVASPAAAGRFVAPGDAIPNFGFSSDAVWARLALTNSQDAPVPLVLHLDAPLIGNVDLYAATPSSGPAPLFRTGAYLPYSTRPLPGRAFAFPLSVPPGATTEYYLRLASDQPIYLGLDLWRPAAFSASQDSDEIAWGIVLGMLLLMTGYNLLLYIALRDHNYLVLVTFGLTVFLSTAVAGGYAARWAPAGLMPSWPLLLPLSAMVVIVAFALLSISFLELRRRLPLAWRVLVGALVVVAAAAVFALLGQSRVALMLGIGVLPVILVTIIISTIVAVRQGSRLALFLLLSQVIPIATGLVQVLGVFGLGPKLGPMPLIVPINSLALLILMSLALADRINLLRREADHANRALQTSEQRLRAYLDALPFNIQVHDAQLKPLYVNAAIRTRNAKVREGWFDEKYDVWVEEIPVRISGTDQPYPTDQLPLIRAARGETAHSDDVDVMMPAGPVTIESWAVPLRDEAGNISAIVTAFQDISQRRATENELAGYRERLEQRVAQRTAELAALNANLAARVTELTAINEVSRRVARIGDLQGMLDEVALIVADAFQIAGVSISLFDVSQQHMEVVVLADRTGGVLRRFAGLSFTYAAAAGYSIRAQNAAVFASPSELQGMPVELRADLAAAGVQQVLLAPLIAREAAIGALALLATDAERTYSADEVRVVQTIAGQVAAAIDTVRLIDEVRSQRDVAEALRDTATALSRDLDQQNVLWSILEQLDQVFACDGAAVALVEGAELVVAAAKGTSAACSGRRTPLDGQSASSCVLRERRALLIEDTQQQAGEGADGADGPPDVCCADEQGIRCWLGAPLISGGHAIGVLSLDSLAPDSFTPAQAALLSTFADQAAIAVTNARLYDQAQALAVAGERNRIARDLHDAVTQTIFSASLIASTLPARLPDAPPEAQADLDALQMLTKGALAEMRMLLLELRPERLAEVRLDTLLTQLAQAFAGRNGVQVQVDANCDPLYTPPYAVKIAFYRVAQEALNNAGKHARATHLIVRFSSRPGSLHMAIIDDGRGFAPGAVGPEQMGLAIMQERAAAAGAQLTVDSEPGLGTHLFMVWNDENNSQTT